MVTITESAKKEIIDFLKSAGPHSGVLLQIKVVPGGCSGFQYEMNAVSDEDLTDEEIFDGLIAIDKKSMTMLDGSTIDYVSDLQGGGITINNPNTKGGCGCGKSFCG